MTTYTSDATLAGQVSRAGRFGVVGLVGFGVNLLAQAAFTELGGISYLAGAVLATQVSSTCNFGLAELWVFRTPAGGSGAGGRYAGFLAMNNAALVLRVPMMWFLVDLGGVHYSLANLVSLVVLTGLRFGIADRVIWRVPAVAQAPAGATPAPVRGGSRPGFLYRARPRRASKPRHGLRAVAMVELVPVLRRPLTHRFQYVGMAVVVVAGASLRLWRLMEVGFNSDEAVYASQAAGIAGDPAVSQFFPIFRAHPFLFQAMLSVPFHLGTSELVARLLSVGFGLGTIVVVFCTARLLYGSRVALIAAGIVALMPYHVVVTRQVLLDGPMAFFATLALYLIARYVATRRLPWLLAASCALSLTVLTKETYIVLVGSLFTFFALSPEIRLRVRDIVLSAAVFLLTLLPYPITIFAAGKSETGKSYLSWQLFRRPNHELGFYATTLPSYIGWVVLGGAVIALVLTWGPRRSWKERLLLSWIAVPAVFFTIWPVKGFHYLLAAAMPLSVFAALGIDAMVTGAGRRWPARSSADPGRPPVWRSATVVPLAALAIVASTLAVPSWFRVQPPTSDTFLAGVGGLPGGREAGEWINANTPEGSRFMTVGPSMANLVQWYGEREAHGISVSPNPLNRNPSYEPIVNPDRAIRTNELQYVVWDSYSARRSDFFGGKIIAYADRYHGRPVFTYAPRGEPVIVVYEVRP